MLIFYRVHFSRFKQLKEQEAQKQRQREEERRKSEAASAKGSHVTNDDIKKETSLLEREDSHHASSLGSNFVVSGVSASSIDAFPVNDNSPNLEVNDSEQVSNDMENSSESSDDQKDKTKNLYLDQNVEKVHFHIPYLNFAVAISCKDHIVDLNIAFI